MGEKDKGGAPFRKFDELSRLRYTIAKFKEYDKRRKVYISHLERSCENYRGKIREYESLTERQHNEIDELIRAYEGAKPLISIPEQRAYVFELLERIEYLKPFESLYAEESRRCADLAARVRELEEAAGEPQDGD